MFDKFNRPDWDSYFIAHSFLISRRSIDPNTQCGCVAVDDEHTILSTGYNSPPRGCDDDSIPLVRPDKYAYIEHGESNCIINAARNGTSLKGSTFYITGQPCENCFRKMKGVGVKKIIMAGLGAKCISDETYKIITTLNKVNPIEIVQFTDKTTVTELLEQTSKYHTDRG